MDLRLLFSVGVAFRRQNLMSTDVRYWRLKSTPALLGLKGVCHITSGIYDPLSPDVAFYF